jgi:HEAT repeat protein
MRRSRTRGASSCQTRQPSTVEALRALVRDADPKVRGEAYYWLAQRGGAAVAREVASAVESDTDDGVKRRAVSGIARLPADDAVPLLIQIARTTPNAVIRKEAVSSLSHTNDPRAIAFLEELLKK